MKKIKKKKKFYSRLFATCTSGISHVARYTKYTWNLKKEGGGGLKTEQIAIFSLLYRELKITYSLYSNWIENIFLISKMKDIHLGLTFSFQTLKLSILHVWHPIIVVSFDNKDVLILIHRPVVEKTKSSQNKQKSRTDTFESDFFLKHSKVVLGFFLLFCFVFVFLFLFCYCFFFMCTVFHKLRNSNVNQIRLPSVTEVHLFHGTLCLK